jgi:peptidyl-prolyl cis-trans isomerase SurA
LRHRFLCPTMTLRPYRISALHLPAILASATLVFGFAAGAHSQDHPLSTPTESPYGGSTVEDILARVNDQIITRTDYDRALKEMDDEARQRGANMQAIAEGHKDLLRNLIDQQLWLSKGKEMGITGDIELVKQLDEIRKKYNLASLDDLEKAAKEQNVSFEDFKANIRNQIITSQVIREEVGRKLAITPGEVQRYFEAHKQEYAQPESVHLGEILVSPGGSADALNDDSAKMAAAKAKADDIEAKLKAGGNFDAIARTESDGQTAKEGGELGTYKRGELNKVFEDQTFALKPGDVTEPVHTKQGYVIFKVIAHNPGGVPEYKDVEPQVEDTFFESRMAPAVRQYLTTMREEAYLDIKPGYVDTGASPKETKPIYSAYTPPAPKKKKKAQRTRFRETEHGYRNKNKPALVPVAADTTPAKPADNTANKQSAKANAAPLTMKPGKKEKIRFGQAPRETLPNATETKIEDAGAIPKTVADAAAEEADSRQPAAPVQKTRFAARAKLPKAAKPKGPQLDNFTPASPDASEVADRQTQSAPLGLDGDTSKKKKKKHDTASTGQKTRMQERPKDETPKQPLELTPAAPVPGAPAPRPVNTSPAPASAPQQTPTSPDPPQSTTPASEPPH